MTTTNSMATRPTIPNVQPAGGFEVPIEKLLQRDGVGADVHLAAALQVHREERV